MPVLIPSFASCREEMTVGERHVACMLCKHLPDKCQIWYDIPVGKKRKERRYPDFIILHPMHGMIFLEVKDWLPATLVRADPKTCVLIHDGKKKSTLNPLEQARKAAFAAMHELQKDACLTKNGGHKLSFPCSWGVVFANITRQQMRAMLGRGVEGIFPDYQTLYQDDFLEDEAFEVKIFQKKIWRIHDIQSSVHLSPRQVNAIRAVLFPEIVIGASHVMDEMQERIARNLGRGHRVLHGVAGSGKTMVLAFRARALAGMVKKPVLVTCYTRSLATKLKNMLPGENLEVIQFHEWCAKQAAAHGLLPDTEKFPGLTHWEAREKVVAEGLGRGLIPRHQYGAILIDEGHDFHASWLEILLQMLDPKDQFLLFVYDRAQSTFGKPQDSLNFPTLAGVGIKAQGRTTVLSINYRNSREIAGFAQHLVTGHVNPKEKADVAVLKNIRFAGASCGQFPVVMRFDNLEEEILHIVSCLKKWHKQNPWHAMAVIYPGGTAGLRMASTLQQVGRIPHLHLFEQHDKIRYNPERAEVPIMAVHSCKGLDFPCVAVMDASFAPQGSQSATHFSRSMRQLYVAATRARTELLVTFHRDNVISRALQAAAKEQIAH